MQRWWFDDVDGTRTGNRAAVTKVVTPKAPSGGNRQ
jgi:hypothetical protein